MKNNANDGIFCDYCGNDYQNDFVYYSFDFKEIKIINRSRKASNNIASYDLCGSCMGLFKDRLLEISKISPVNLRCDVTGENLDINNVVYYKCNISKVIVNISGQQYVCEKCQKPGDPQKGPCECGCIKLVRNAKVNADESYVELNFSSSIFNKFVSHIRYIRDLGEAEWTSDQ